MNLIDHTVHRCSQDKRTSGHQLSRGQNTHVNRKDTKRQDADHHPGPFFLPPPSHDSSCSHRPSPEPWLAFFLRLVGVAPNMPPLHQKWKALHIKRLGAREQQTSNGIAPFTGCKQRHPHGMQPKPLAPFSSQLWRELRALHHLHLGCLGLVQESAQLVQPLRIRRILVGLHDPGQSLHTCIIRPKTSLAISKQQTTVIDQQESKFCTTSCHASTMSQLQQQHCRRNTVRRHCRIHRITFAFNRETAALTMEIKSGSLPCLLLRHLTQFLAQTRTP